MQTVELVSQYVSTRSLEPVNYLIRGVASIRLNKQMNMVGSNRQRINLPIMLIGYFTEHLLQPIRNLVFENRSPPLWAPHEMIFHRVGGVTASAVCFFVDWHHLINKTSPMVFRREYSF